MFDLSLYKVFYTVAKCGSITHASEELFISQPAVSQSVKLLESLLGVPLFKRTHSGTVLSQGGKLIYKKVEEALRLLDEVEISIEELKGSVSGSIKIGATDSIFSNILTEKIAKFNSLYPAVKLELISTTSPKTIELLKSGDLDIAFINLPVSESGVNFISTVSTLSDIFVCGKRYENLKNEVLPLERLSEYPLLMIEENTIARSAIGEFLKGLKVTLRPDIEVAGWDLMLKLVIKGMGIGCVPREYCLNELKSGELFEVKTTPALPIRGVSLALPKGVPTPYAVKKFIALFKGEE